jgi:hypothetical protein
MFPSSAPSFFLYSLKLKVELVVNRFILGLLLCLFIIIKEELIFVVVAFLIYMIFIIVITVLILFFCSDIYPVLRLSASSFIVSFYNGLSILIIFSTPLKHFIFKLSCEFFFVLNQIFRIILLI